MKILLKNIIVMSIILLMLSLFSCSAKPVKLDADISSISITQNHMNRDCCYAFSVYAYKDQYILNAWCVVNSDSDNNFKEIDFENVEITEAEFDRFSTLDEEYDFLSCLAEKKDNKKFQVLDETTNSFSVGYDGEMFKLKTDCECYNAVYKYFLQLAEKYDDK